MVLSRPQRSQGCYPNPNNTNPNPNRVNTLWKKKKNGTDRIWTPVTGEANHNAASWATLALSRCGLLHIFNSAIDYLDGSNDFFKNTINSEYKFTDFHDSMEVMNHCTVKQNPRMCLWGPATSTGLLSSDMPTGCADALRRRTPQHFCVVLKRTWCLAVNFVKPVWIC